MFDKYCFLNFSNSFILNSNTFFINSSKDPVLLLDYKLKEKYLLLKYLKYVSKILQNNIIYWTITKFGYKYP